MNARQFKLKVVEPSALVPAWVTTAINNGWDVGTWAAISGASPSYGLSATNTLQSVAVGSPSADSLNQAIIDSWTGAALCTGFSTYGCMFYGPTGNHFGVGARGDSFLFDLNTRRWECVQPPLTDYVDNGPYGEYPDGSPITNHSSWWPFYDANRNEFAYPKGWGSRTSASSDLPKTYGHGFSLSSYLSAGRSYSASQWRRFPELAGLTANEVIGLSQQCGGAWDESRKSLWIVAAHNSYSSSGLVARYDSVANTWTTYAKQWCIFLYGAYGIDPVRDLLVMPAASYGVRVLQLGSPNARSGAETSTNSLWQAAQTGTGPTSLIHWGWEWSEALGGFVQYSWADSASRVKLATPSGGTSFGVGPTNNNYSLAWSSLTSPSNTVSPEPIRSAGANNKFRVVRWGTQEIALFNARSEGAMYAFRLN